MRIGGREQDRRATSGADRGGAHSAGGGSSLAGGGPRFRLLHDYVISLKDQPDDAFPLFRFPQLVEESNRRVMKGEPREAVERSVRSSVRDVSFLIYLALAANKKVLQEKRANWLHVAFVVEGLRPYVAGYEPWEGERLQAWLHAISALLWEVLPLDGAIAKIGQRYFGGRSVLFPDAAEDLRELVQQTEKAVQWFNDCQEMGLLGPPPTKKVPNTPLCVIDLPAIKEGSRAAAGQLAGYLIDSAKADALVLVGERHRAFDVMSRHI